MPINCLVAHTQNYDQVIHKYSVTMQTHDPDKVLLTPKENKCLIERARYNRLKLKFTPEQLKAGKRNRESIMKREN